MLPLAFIDSDKIQVKKREARLDGIFRDVISEAGSLVSASRVCLFIKVDEPRVDRGKSPTPSSDGKFLFGKWYDTKNKSIRASEKVIPLGRGIISRAVLTGEAWKVDDVQQEPDYDEKLTPNASTMLCVPVVLDGSGKSIGVLQAVNKSSGAATGENKFTDQDVQIFKALASHISVSLHRLYKADDEEEEIRLRDTIQVMRDYDVSGLVNTGNKDTSLLNRRVALFNDD